MRTNLTGLGAVGLSLTLGAGSALAQDSCITDRIEGTETPYQTVILENSCNEIVDISMCVSVSNREEVEQHSFMVSPRGRNQIGISLGTNGRVTYRYVYNWCWGSGCPNQVPSCVENAAPTPPPADRGQPQPPQPQPPGPRRL